MKVRCTIMRGGTSKGIYFRDEEVPADQEIRDALILRVMGSPDRRQIDGLGGADIHTSKAVIIRPSEKENADVDYIFGRVYINAPEIDWNTICGNLSAAVGSYSLYEGLLTAVEPFTTVRINCPSTGRIITATIPVKDGQVVEEGDFSLSGVPGTGAKIALDYSNAAGGLTGSLLPTGKVVDHIQVPGLGEIEGSIVDCGNLVFFVRAQDLGLTGEESPLDIDSDQEIIARIESIRRAVAEYLGMADRFDWGHLTSPLLPLLGMLQSPRTYKSFAEGIAVTANEMDLFSTIYSGGSTTHKAYPGTAIVCTGTAAKIEGSLVNRFLSAAGRERDEVRIGHPSGTIPVEAVVEKNNEQFAVRSIRLMCTARRVMEGYAYVPDNFLQNSPRAISVQKADFNRF